MEQEDAVATGLEDLVVSVERWMVDDEGELGQVAVGQRIRHLVGIWSRAWSPATRSEPSVVFVEGETSRLTGRVDESGGVFDGVDIVCGPARFWLFTGAVAPGSPSGPLAPIVKPALGSWVDVEGSLYVRPWYEVADEIADERAGMAEHDSGSETTAPTSCDWLVCSVVQGGESWVLHLARLLRVHAKCRYPSPAGTMEAHVKGESGGSPWLLRDLCRVRSLVTTGQR